MRIRHALMLGGGLLWVLFAAEGAAASVSVEEAKAEFVYRITQFVDWEVPESHEALVIGVVGDAQFANLLRKVVKGRTVKGLPIVVEEGSEYEALGQVHVIFVGGGNRRQLNALISAIPERSILTLGDSEAFLKAGGMISILVSRAGKIHLSAKTSLLTDSGLRVSSRLMRILVRK